MFLNSNNNNYRSNSKVNKDINNRKKNYFRYPKKIYTDFRDHFEKKIYIKK